MNYILSCFRELHLKILKHLITPKKESNLIYLLSSILVIYAINDTRMVKTHLALTFS